MRTLQGRGTLFWQCAIALNAVAGQIADARNLPVADVRADLAAGLNPGVELVPSHVMALASGRSGRHLREALTAPAPAPSGTATRLRGAESGRKALPAVTDPGRRLR